MSGFGSKEPLKLYEVIDFHPYVHRTAEQILDTEYAQELTKIAKLPMDQRAEARRDLRAKYEQARQDIIGG